MNQSEKDLPSGLYIIATPIGNLGDITLRALDTLRKVSAVACEDTRETGKLLAAYEVKTAKIPYHDHNAVEMRPKIIRMIGEGKSVALVSDAGMPLISDPGYKLVEECIAAGVYVTCLPGATASLTALALSGLPTDRFMFAGFLPPKSAARKSALQELKNIPATLVFYETAPRLLESLEDMQAVLGDRRAAVARELTKKFEEVKRENLSGLIAYYRDAGAPRGEIVIVIDAAGDEAGGWSEADVERLLRQKLFQENMSVKDASALVAAETGLKKKDIYQRALLLNKRK